MTCLRVMGVFFTLIGFFALGAPMQWIVLRLKPSSAYVLSVFFNRLLLHFLQIRVVLHGETPQARPGAAPPQLLVANHVSWIDIPALGTLNTISFLAKQEIARWPIIATFARLQTTIFVDRDSRKSIREANAAMAARMQEGGWVALFPEGTTHDGLALGRFHSSHLAAARDLLEANPQIEAVRIQPVAIRYSAAHAAWLGDDLLLPHVMELIKGPPITCDLFFSAPLNFDRASDRKLIAGQCTEKIEAMLAGARDAPADQSASAA
ncbi:MAG TPA: lysophospholipid acyltransferase family protein [Methylovirgula sp.]